MMFLFSWFLVIKTKHRTNEKLKGCLVGNNCCASFGQFFRNKFFFFRNKKNLLRNVLMIMEPSIKNACLLQPRRFNGINQSQPFPALCNALTIYDFRKWFRGWQQPVRQCLSLEHPKIEQCSFYTSGTKWR